jgi:general secretion pathway protein D
MIESGLGCRAAFVAILMLAGALCSAAPAQELADDGQNFVINLRDADIRALAEQVSEITGRSLILDPAVAGTVTVISAQPLTQAGVWDLFQSVLRVQGFAALRSGAIWRVVPQAVVREAGGELGDGEDASQFDVVTRLVRLENFPSPTAVAALRPLVASFGYIEALPETNSLVITDTVENADRIEAIARTLDEGDGSQLSTIPVRNADATEIAAALTNVLGAEGGLAMRVAIDARNNVLLVRGNPELTDRVRLLVEELDQPGRRPPALVPITRVYRLRFADAARTVEVLRGIVGIGAGVALESPVAESMYQPIETLTAQEPEITDQFEVPEVPVGGTELSFTPPPVTSLAAEDINIQPAVELNAVVIRARAEVQDDLAQLVAQLDQRRPQVLIEAAIVEISGDIAEQLGVQLGFGDAAPDATFAATSFNNSGPALQNILRLLRVPVSPAISPSGLSIGLSTQDEFGVLIQALGQSTKANLLSTPSVTTLDNQVAQILVGQNVPFRTGTYVTGGNADDPFTTIERQDVGITLRVVPQVNEGDVIQLDVSQEVSSISNANVPDAADIITNRRLIETTVLADNGGTIVLGGLITDDRLSNKTKVPGLGDIPGLGRLFSSSGENATKRVLFVFLRPTILRTRTEISRVSNERFQRLRSIEATPERAVSLVDQPRPIRKLPVEINGLY